MTLFSLHRRSAGLDPATAPRSPRAGRLGVALLSLVAALVMILPVAASAQSSSTEAQKRDEVRRKKADLAASIDVMNASDDDLENAVRTLNENLKAQQARARDAAQASDEAKAHVDGINADVARKQAEVDALVGRVRARAIEIYVHPGGKFDTADEALHTADFTNAERKAELLDSATGHDNDVEDQLRAAKAGLESKRNESAVAEQEAELRRAEADAQVKQLQVAKEEKERVKAALDKRIADFQGEVSALNAEDARLTALILASQAASEGPDVVGAPPAGAATGPTPTEAPTTTRPGTPPGSGASTTTSRPTSTTRPSSPPPAPGGVGRLSWPVGGTISSPYGPRWGAFHPGIDISAPEGSPISASAPGVVIYAAMNGGGYGNLVLVDHGGGMVTAYAHQSRIAVSVGQSVSRGQLLGYVGCTGSCTGPHVHFEVRINGSTQDPMAYL